MRNNSCAPHYAISRYSIREFKTGAEPFMVAMIIIIIIIYDPGSSDLSKSCWGYFGKIRKASLVN